MGLVPGTRETKTGLSRRRCLTVFVGEIQFKISTFYSFLLTGDEKFRNGFVHMG